MSDTDRLLQDYFDRLRRGEDADPPADADAADLAAYRLVYDSLGEPPDGDELPDTFAESVADRVGLTEQEQVPERAGERAEDRAARPSPARSDRARQGWGEELALAALLVAAAIGVVFLPVPWGPLADSLADAFGSARRITTVLAASRLDVIAASAAALAIAGTADLLLRRWTHLPPRHRTRISST